MANGGLIGPVKVVCTPSTKVHTFNSTGTFLKKNCTSTIPEVMVVAGGGGGGDGAGGGGGGGGAGGYRTATCVALPNAPVAITVGGGGNNASTGQTGNQANLGSVLSSFGGGGGCRTNGHS